MQPRTLTPAAVFLETIKTYIKDYEEDRKGLLHAEETASLQKIKKIIPDIESWITNNTFTNENKTRAIQRIRINMPPEQIIVRSSKPGPHFWSSDIVVEDIVKLPLHAHLTALIEVLNKISLEPVVAAATTSTNTVVEERLRTLETKIQTIAESSFAQGKQEGVAEGKQQGFADGQTSERKRFYNLMIEYVKSNEQAKDLLQICFPGYSTNNDSPSAASSSSTSSSKPTETTLTVEEQKNKLLLWVGASKAAIIDVLTANLKRLSEAEKLGAKFIIFQLMLHKNDKTIEEVVNNCVHLMKDIPIDNLTKIISACNVKEDKSDLSNESLTEECLKTFNLLLGDKLNPRYLDKDGTGCTVFKGLWSLVTGNDKLEPVKVTEAQYVDNFKTKIAKLTKAASNGLDQNSFFGGAHPAPTPAHQLHTAAARAT